MYHSQYDDYFWMSRFGDPGFHLNTTLARLMSVIAWRLANADILPFDYSDYAAAVLEHIDAIEEKAQAGASDRARPPRGPPRDGGRRRPFALKPSCGSGTDPLDAERSERAQRPPRSRGARHHSRGRHEEQAVLQASRLRTAADLSAGGAFPASSRRSSPANGDAIEGFEAELAAAFDRAAELMDQSHALVARP